MWAIKTKELAILPLHRPLFPSFQTPDTTQHEDWSQHSQDPQQTPDSIL